jgi:hypothetical protein
MRCFAGELPQTFFAFAVEIMSAMAKAAVSRNGPNQF